MSAPVTATMHPTAPDWPPEFVERYVSAGFWRSETFGGVLKTVAGRMGAQIALVDGDRRLSFEELDRSVDELAAGFAGLGLGKGDVVVVQLPNRAAFVEVVFALFRLGSVPVFALPAHRSVEIGAFCGFTGAKAYIVADVVGGFDYRELAADIRARAPALAHVIVDGEPGPFLALDRLRRPPVDLPAIDAGDLACFQLSGGTTGIPKLIARRHRDYLYNVRASVEACDFNERTVYLAALPMGHNFPMACPGFLGTLLAGGRVVVTDRPTPDVCFDLIARENVTATALVPPLAMVWLDVAEMTKPQVPSLRILQVGGARLGHEAARRVAPALGCRLQQVFGMAEGLICFTAPEDPDDVVLNTQGKPMSTADEVRIVDGDGNDVPDGVTGHLLTRGPYTIRGYFGLSEQNAASFTPDGFYRSGDLVRRVAGGQLVVEGRDTDQINRGGEKIAAEEVENFLLGHEGVLDVAVVGLPDGYLGERTCAFVLPRPSRPTPNDLRMFLKASGLAAFKIPDRFEFLDSFPTTGVGKISRKTLRETLKAMHSGAGAAPAASAAAAE